MSRTPNAGRAALRTATMVTALGAAVGCGGEEPAAGPRCFSAWYGPMPCDGNAVCEAGYGPQWYCDKDNFFQDECGRTYWPICNGPWSPPKDASADHAPDVSIEAATDPDVSIENGTFDVVNEPSADAAASIDEGMPDAIE